MPVNQVNWGQVQSNAMSNALNMAKAQEIGRTNQARNIMTQHAQQGVGLKESANVLAQQGFHDIADQQNKRAVAEQKAKYDQQVRNEEQVKKVFKGARNQKQLDYAFAAAQELGASPERIELMRQQIGTYKQGLTEYQIDGMLGGDPTVDWKNVAQEGMMEQQRPFYKGVELPAEMFPERPQTPRWKTTASLAETKDAIGLSKAGKNKIEVERMTNEKNLYGLVDGLDSIKDFVSSPEFIGGTSGDVVSIGNSLTNQFKQLTGVDKKWESISNEDLDSGNNNLTRLRKAAINGDRMSALQIELAYTLSKMVDPSSKVTDKDFDFAKRMLGTGADRTSIIATLKDMRKRHINKYNVSESLLQKNKGVKPRLYDEDFYKKSYGREDKKEVDYKLKSNKELFQELLNAE